MTVVRLLMVRSHMGPQIPLFIKFLITPRTRKAVIRMLVVHMNDQFAEIVETLIANKALKIDQSIGGYENFNVFVIRQIMFFDQMVDNFLQDREGFIANLARDV